MTIKKWIGKKYKALTDWKYLRLSLDAIALIEVALIIIFWREFVNFQIHKEWLKIISFLIIASPVPLAVFLKNSRLLTILTFAAVELAAIIYFWECIEKIFGLVGKGNARLTNILPILFAAPVALLIWYWRDQNKRADIENARADLLQKDFHQIEKWATESDGVLQVAAIHQLHPYATATGAVEKVTDFQKPASEIYKALLSTWGEKAEAVAAKTKGLPPEEGGGGPPPHIIAIHKIVKKDWSKFPDDFLYLIYLGYANLSEGKFEGADLRYTFLGAANLRDAKLMGADLCEAYLEGADFTGADLRGAKLFNANLAGAYLMGADLCEADDLARANLNGAQYSKETKFPDGFKPEEHEMVLLK